MPVPLGYARPGHPYPEGTDARDVPTDARDVPTDARDVPTDARDVPTDARDVPTDARDVPTNEMKHTHSILLVPFALPQLDSVHFTNATISRPEDASLSRGC